MSHIISVCLTYISQISQGILDDSGFPHMVNQTRTLITRATGEDIRQVDMRCLSQGELKCAPGSAAWIDWTSVTCIETSKTMYSQVHHTEVTTAKCVNLKQIPPKGSLLGQHDPIAGDVTSYGGLLPHGCPRSGTTQRCDAVLWKLSQHRSRTT